MKKILLKTFFMITTLVLINNVNYAQTFSCVVNGNTFTGKVTEALQVNIGKQNFLQIKIQNGDKGMYLYLKVDKIKGELPVKLEYMPHNYETGQTPDAEIIWVPDGPDNPQWNSIEGSSEITKFDEAAKTISGSFEFEIEKMVYGTDNQKETAKIKDGKFEGIVYKIDVPTKK